MAMTTVRILMLGDHVGQPGRAIFKKHVAQLRSRLGIDAIIVNGENSSTNGRGITPAIAQFYRNNHVDVVTTGNHVWQCADIHSYLVNNKDILRPANFPADTPGIGATTFNCKGTTIGVINVQGRTFMKEHLDCPFRTVDSLLTFFAHQKVKVIVVDFHAEATSEKYAMGYHLDGRVSGVFGTHTHVPTADERILPGGTAYCTDLGMAGALNSMIGMRKEPIIRTMLTQMPSRFIVDTQMPLIMTGVWVEVDTDTGKALSIERVRIIDDAVPLEDSE
jgi:2',3'-cyclic-nucleotide 2'-phosphodiesterase